MLSPRKEGKSLQCEPNETSPYFCIDESEGTMFINNAAIKTDKIEKYALTLEATNILKNCTTENITLEVFVTPHCFPMDILYSNVQNHCPTWDKRRFVDSSATETWPTEIFKVFVNSGIVLGQLELDSNHIDTIISGRYIIYLKTSVKTYIITFEYIDGDSRETNTESPRLLESKATGKILKVSFHREILITKPENISITIDKFGVEHPHLYFQSKDAITLFGSNQLKKCPSGQCLEHFSNGQK